MSGRGGGSLGAPLRVATVGAGYFSGFHADAWMRNPDADLVGLADLDTAKASALLSTCVGDGANPSVFSTAEQMFDDLAPEIIDIATPPHTHLKMIEAALRTDAKAIICQKPFCGNLADARIAAEMIAEAGKLVIVHENFRFQPWYRTIKREIEAGRIGDLYQITFKLRPGDGQGGDTYLDRREFTSARRGENFDS